MAGFNKVLLSATDSPTEANYWSLWTLSSAESDTTGALQALGSNLPAPYSSTSKQYVAMLTVFNTYNGGGANTMFSEALTAYDGNPSSEYISVNDIANSSNMNLTSWVDMSDNDTQQTGTSTSTTIGSNLASSGLNGYSYDWAMVLYVANSTGGGSSSGSEISNFAINHTQAYGSNANTVIDHGFADSDSVNSVTVTTAFNALKTKVDAQSTHSLDDLLMEYLLIKDTQPFNTEKFYDFIEKKV